MKRFTDTDKWRDPWFRKLSSPAKQLWGYLLDQCDKIGLVEIDLALASADCGQKITEIHLAELGDRLESCGNGKHLIPKFIQFQYGSLTPSCPPHRPILKLVAVHGLIQDGLLYHYPNARVLVPRKIVQEEDKDNREGVQGERPLRNAPTVTRTLEAVKAAAARIGLPEAEAQHFFDHYESNGWKVGRNPMRSMPHALANWKRNYDAGHYTASKPGARQGFDRNAGTFNAGKAEQYNLRAIQEAKRLQAGG